MTTQQHFPFVPDYMSWEDWNGNFVLYYGQEPIAVHPEEEWRLSAQHIASLLIMQPYPIPNPDRYENWQDWAREVTTIINGPSH